MKRETENGISLSSLGLVLLMAYLLFSTLFLNTEKLFVDFWWWMSGSLLLLVSIAALTDKTFVPRLIADAKQKILRKIVLGLLSAVFLYGVFSAGEVLINQFFPEFAGSIGAVYNYRGDASFTRIVLLMLFVIGPGEEFFWRAFVQHHLVQRFGLFRGLGAAVLLYTSVHLTSGNIVLLAAAFSCGFFWGLLYQLKRSPVLNAASHIAWDIAVFLLFPFA